MKDGSERSCWPSQFTSVCGDQRLPLEGCSGIVGDHA
jgi:hypothetical protein